MLDADPRDSERSGRARLARQPERRWVVKRADARDDDPSLEGPKGMTRLSPSGSPSTRATDLPSCQWGTAGPASMQEGKGSGQVGMGSGSIRFDDWRAGGRSPTLPSNWRSRTVYLLGSRSNKASKHLGPPARRMNDGEHFEGVSMESIDGDVRIVADDQFPVPDTRPDLPRDGWVERTAIAWRILAIKLDAARDCLARHD